MDINFKPSGVIWAGNIYDVSGYGNMSRYYIKSLLNIGIPVRVHNMGPINQNIGKFWINTLNRITNSFVGSSPILVIHHIPPSYKKIRIPGVYKRIGCTIFETDRIPKSWVRPCNEMDEVWVPSHFNLETFSKSGVKREKIRVVPYGVDTDIFNPSVKPLPLPGLKKFKFLYIFNYSPRKAPELLIEAYLKEFNQGDDVCLILKVIGTDYPNLKFDQDVIEKLIKKIAKSRKNLPQIHLISSLFSVTKLARLYAACNCYVSVDRANGWGLPCMEAMATGKPAVTINWSGSTEFMNEHNSFLIKPNKIVTVSKNFYTANPIYYRQKWADVDIRELMKLMRFIYLNYQKREEISFKGYRTIVNNYSIDAISKKTAQELGFSKIKILNRVTYLLNLMPYFKGKLLN